MDRSDTPEEKRLKLEEDIRGGFYGCVALLGGIFLLSLAIALPVTYCQNREPLKRDNPLSVELRPYDLNNDGRLDPSELEKFQRDYEFKKR